MRFHLCISEVEKIYEEISVFEPLSLELENQYLLLLRNNAVDAREKDFIRNKILMSHQRLLLLMAIKFFWSSNSKDVYNKDDMILDLYNAAIMGFMYAIGKYIPTKGVKLTTYAANWCRFYMQKQLIELLGQNRTIYRMNKVINENDRHDAERHDAESRNKHISKWMHYFLDARESVYNNLEESDVDEVIEIRMALDELGENGTFLKDYYSIDSSLSMSDFKKKYGITTDAQLKNKSDFCKKMLRNKLLDYEEEIDNVLMPLQLEFDFEEKLNSD